MGLNAKSKRRWCFMPRLTASELSRRILSPRGESVEDPESLAEATEIACGKLRSELQVLVGPHGARGILQHALGQAQRGFDFLRGLEVGEGEEDCLPGLREQLRQGDRSRIGEGVAALLANALLLLERFLGEELTLSLARRAWPDLVGGDTELGDRG